MKLLLRSSMPDTPVPWLVTVALNQWRNTRNRDARRHELLTPARGADVMGDASADPDQAVLADEARRRARRTLDTLPERQVQLLLLSAEGYSYREIASALELTESSVGALILRAKRAFRAQHEGPDAS